MYDGLVILHSSLRYVLLLLLLVVIVKSLLGLLGNKPIGKADNLVGLSLFSATHLQLLFGLILYFISPLVSFNATAMKDPIHRYWTSEHIVIMLLAVAFITLARTSSKKMKDDLSRHKRMLLFNSIALVLIIVAIAMSKRGFFSMPGSGV